MLQPDKLFKFYETHVNHLITEAIFQQLPDILSMTDMSFLLACDGEKTMPSPARQASFHMKLRDAAEIGSLKGTHINVPNKFIPDAIHRDDFKRWLREQGEWPLNGCLLAKWWTESEPQAEAVPDAGKIKKKSNDERRHKIAVDWYADKGKPDMQPYTNEAIKDMLCVFSCEDDKSLWTSGGLNWVNHNGNKIWGVKQSGLKPEDKA